MRDPLREAAGLGWRPVPQGFGGGRERRAFADPKQQTHDDQAGEPADHPGSDRGDYPDETADEERQTSTDAVADPAADDLEHRIRVGERRKGHSELQVRQPELLLHDATRRGEVHPIDVEDE